MFDIFRATSTQKTRTAKCTSEFICFSSIISLKRSTSEIKNVSRFFGKREIFLITTKGLQE